MRGCGSLGSNGRIVEWSLHSLRTELWSADVSDIWKSNPELAGRAAAVMPELALNVQVGRDRQPPALYPTHVLHCSSGRATPSWQAGQQR